MLTTEYAHLEDRDGVPHIKNKRFRVIDLAMSYLAYGWSPDELHRHFSILSKAEICSALAYYFDHEEEMNTQMLKEGEEMERLKKESDQPSRLELKARLSK